MFYYDFILLQNDFQCWCEIVPIEKRREREIERETVDEAHKCRDDVKWNGAAQFRLFGVCTHIHMSLFCLYLIHRIEWLNKFIMGHQNKI